MRSGIASLVVVIVGGLIIACALSGCSIGYLTSSAWQQAKILASREPLEKANVSSELTAAEKALIANVPAVRRFAEHELKLEVGGAYSKFAVVPKDALSWILMAAKKDSFTLQTWWFPIVGTVPYKGFSTEESAQAAANKLENAGFETWVRPAGAFSSLGWFDDPVVSSMLQDGRIALTNTLIHELSHRTFWIKNDVDFNESIANVIGGLGAIDYFSFEQRRCSADMNLSDCSPEFTILLKTACSEFAKQRELSVALDELYKELLALYDRNVPTVLSDRDTIFAAWRYRYPNLGKNWLVLNNARLMQAKLYYTRFNDLVAVVTHLGIPKTVAELTKEPDPWEWLDNRLLATTPKDRNFDADICGQTS